MANVLKMEKQIAVVSAPITTPRKAVQAYIASEYRKEQPKDAS